MNYKEIIRLESVDEYRELHKLFYRTLSSMIFDMSFVESCSNLQNSNPDINSDWISIKFLFRDVYENLLMKVSRCFFDNSGSDATNLFGFKNKVIGGFIEEKYREEFIKQIAGLPIEDKLYKTKMNNLKRNVLGLRDQYIAHGLIAKQSEELCVDLKDIKELVKNGCQLFQVLSFDPPLDFYSWIEGDGYDLSSEFDFTKKSTELFVKYSMLSSRRIVEIACVYDEYMEKEEMEAIMKIVSDINDEKREHKHYM